MVESCVCKCLFLMHAFCKSSRQGEIELSFRLALVTQFVGIYRRSHMVDQEVWSTRAAAQIGH